jgi:hypothetical protein
LLLAGDRLGRTLAGAGVGVRALTANRQAAAMAQTAIAAEIHQALDIGCGLAAKVALDGVIAVDGFADLENFSVREFGNATFNGDVRLFANFLGVGFADAMNVLQRDDDALLSKKPC